MWAVCFDWASLYALQGIEPLSHAEGGRMGRVALERHGSRAHGSRRKHGYSVSMATGTTTDVRPRENCIAPDIAFIVWTYGLRFLPTPDWCYSTVWLAKCYPLRVYLL